MGKKDVQYDHSWRIAPERGRNWASSDYVKYTHTYKEYPTLSIPVKTAGAFNDRPKTNSKSKRRIRNEKSRKATMRNYRGKYRQTYKKNRMLL